MIFLAIDCAASWCAACVYDAESGRELGREVRNLGKGHAEHLIAVIDRALAASGKSYGDLSAIAVSIGPGSFTGIRIGIAAARGFALALSVPAVGVNTLEALAAEADLMDGHDTVMAALSAGDNYAYVGIYQSFATIVYHPCRMSLEEAAVLARRDRTVLTGSAADAIAARMQGLVPSIVGREATADISVYAAVAAHRGLLGPKPSPLYLREPDAKPQVGFVLPRGGDR